MGQIQSLDELISFLRRRKFLILGCLLAGTIAAVLLALARPQTYEASATIQVETPTVTANASENDRSTAAAQVLQSIEQRLTTRENLTAVIGRHGLYSDAPGLSDDRKLSALRNSISFQGVDSAAGQAFGQARNLSAIIITARLGDAELAARVANDFAQGVLDLSAAGTRDRAEQNVAFFAEDEARLWDQLSALEHEIADYKNQHSAALPTEATAMRSELSSLDTDLRRATQDRVAAAREAETIQAKGTLRETDRRQLEELTQRIGVLDAQIATADARRSELAAALSATPEVERALAAYDRQLSQMQSQYEVVTGRLAEARTDLRLAERQQSERFTLLDRALTPESPVGGGRKKIVMAGALASLLAGLGLAFVLDLLNPVVRTSAQMERQLGLRPVVLIPDVPPRERRSAAGKLRQMLQDTVTPSGGVPRAVVLGGVALALVAVTAALIA
jgi:uncharacterized protein involved in exopolysaccharide biosynthesis